MYFSAVKFAELCAKASFRMHLRTESALERVLALLNDAPEVPVCFTVRTLTSMINVF